MNVPVAMASVPSPSPSPRRMSPRARQIAEWAWTAVLVLVCGGLAIAAGLLYGALDNWSFPTPLRWMAGYGAFVMAAVAVLLVWRHRAPVLVTGIVALFTVVFPTSPLTVLVAAAALTATRTGRARWLMLAAAWMAVSASLWWNLLMGQSMLARLGGDPELGSSGRAVLAAVVPLIAAALLLPFVGFGIERRTRRERDAAQAGEAAATRHMAVLHEEVQRERDRQHLARELHDTLAARLSAVSLHAGALELSVDEGDAKAIEAARRVREAAQGSLDELRGLVHVLRHPESAGPEEGIDDLAELIDAANDGGADVRAQVFLSGTGYDEEVSHAVYRLVQESVSNALRHAPGAPLRVELRGGPETGLTLQVHNPVRPGAAKSSTGGGHGVAGMRERVELLHGAFQAGVTPTETFAVVAWLPWQPDRSSPPAVR